MPNPKSDVLSKNIDVIGYFLPNAPYDTKVCTRPNYRKYWEDLVNMKFGISGFKPGNSCINQVLAITHNIYKSFDGCLDVRAVFLDISKSIRQSLTPGFSL